MPARLILHADDFGLTAGVNGAVLELYRAGVLTSASLMVTGPAADGAMAIARAHPGLGVGCHLVFVDGMPVSHPESIPSLLGADGKTFRPSLADFAQAALRGTLRAPELARETQAQIQVLQRAGLDVTHVDTHKHTHVFPAVLGPVLHAAARCGVQAVRTPFEPRWSRELAGAPLLRRAQLALLGRFEPGFRTATRELEAHGFIPAGTLGIAATGTLTAAVLSAMLQALGQHAEHEQVYELCCHPGVDPDPGLDQVNTRLRSSRPVEREALSTVVPDILAHPSAPTLIHYGSLGVPGLQRASGQFVPHDGYEKVL